MSSKPKSPSRPPETLEPALLARDGRREGDEIRFRCPYPDRHNHGDANPSARYHTGKLVWYCDVCQQRGGWKNLCRLLNLAIPRPTRSRSEVVAVYEYRGEAGELLRRKKRWEPGFGGRDKSFSWEKPAADGKWVRCKGDGNPRVLYRSERLPQARDAGAAVLVVEGERDADCAGELGLCAVTNPEGATGKGKWKAEYSRQLQGLDVAVIADRDAPGRAHARAAAASLRRTAASVRLLELPGEGVKDLSDWVTSEVREGRDREEIARRLVALVEETPEWQPELPAPPAGDAETSDSEADDDRADDGPRKETQSDMLLRIAQAAELFHDPGGEAFARVPVEEHHEIWPVHSRVFRDWLLQGYYLETGKAPSAQALKEALNTLEARARFDGEEHEVFTRVAGVGSKVYLDLCNPEWEVVEITAAGWQVLRKVPVRFQRTPVMRPLPRPVGGGSLTELRPLVNLLDDPAFVLLVAFLVAALGPRGPYPVLVLHGEQGSAKSSLARLVAFLTDPSAAPLRTVPRNEEDLMIAASHSRLLAFDNLSGLPSWFSDALCRLSTGGGFSTRQLYTNRDEIVFSAIRPVVLNGIDEVVGRQDLVDRSLVLSLPAIPEEARRCERELWDEVEALRPRLLGALLDAVSCGLRRRNEVRLDRSPRMADFAHWVVAAEPALPWPAGAFLAAYEANRGEAVESSLEADEVAVAVRELVAEQSEFEGTAQELLATLEARVAEGVRKSRFWPKNPRALSARLRRSAPGLRRGGVDVITGLRNRHMRLAQITGADLRPDRHNRHEAPETAALDRDAKPGRVTQAAANGSAESPRPDGHCDGRDGRDAKNQPDSEPAGDEEAFRL
jgi:hypothetical protein